MDRGSIRVGYVVYPPLLIKDPNTGKLSGVSYDIVEAAAKNLGLKTDWAEEVGWGSMIEGLRTNRYDIIGTQIWPNSQRAREASFSKPVMYSLLYAYGRAHDSRFGGNLSRLNNPAVILATIDGEITSFVAKDSFPQAKIVALPQLSSPAEVLLTVTTGKADATFTEPVNAAGYLKNNPGSIQKIGSAPIRTYENVFAVARGNDAFLGMWNTALTELAFDGSIKRILEKYDVLGSFFPPAAPVGTSW